MSIHRSASRAYTGTYEPLPPEYHVELSEDWIALRFAVRNPTAELAKMHGCSPQTMQRRLLECRRRTHLPMVPAGQRRGGGPRAGKWRKDAPLGFEPFISGVAVVERATPGTAQ